MVALGNAGAVTATEALAWQARATEKVRLARLSVTAEPLSSPGPATAPGIAAGVPGGTNAGAVPGGAGRAPPLPGGGPGGPAGAWAPAGAAHAATAATKDRTSRQRFTGIGRFLSWVELLRGIRLF